MFYTVIAWKKVQKYADVICESPLRNFKIQMLIKNWQCQYWIWLQYWKFVSVKKDEENHLLTSVYITCYYDHTYISICVYFHFFFFFPGKNQLGKTFWGSQLFCQIPPFSSIGSFISHWGGSTRMVWLCRIQSSPPNFKPRAWGHRISSCLAQNLPIAGRR